MGKEQDIRQVKLLEQAVELLRRIETYLRPKNMATTIELKVEATKNTGLKKEKTDEITTE